jgi:2-oxoglutarate dehydrogenase complex dehydrogenase (E1) component-like enzyme
MSTKNNQPPGSNYASRANLDFLEQLYQDFQKNPESVSLEWKRFFEGFDFGQTKSFGLSEKELDVYHLITAYRNYGHFEAHLDPLTNSATPSDQLSLSRFNLSEADLDQKFQIGSIVSRPTGHFARLFSTSEIAIAEKFQFNALKLFPKFAIGLSMNLKPRVLTLNFPRKKKKRLLFL